MASPNFEVMGNEDEWEYHFDKSEEAKRVLDGFASELIKNGWEPLSERGENWWHLRFRRRTK